jgi:hypothetical protein
MVKKTIIPIVATAAFITAVGLLVRNPSIMAPLETPTTPVQSTVIINEKDISVTLAETSEEREKGLSGVSSLEENSGMLFIFDEESVAPKFWMKNMLIPLDIVWINDSKIIKIDKNVPIPLPDTSDDKIKTYSPNTEVDYVLEVNAGFCDSNSIKVGDEVNISGI